MERNMEKSRRGVWNKIISDWRDSEQSVAAFCEKHGCSKSGFFKWRRRFESEGVMEKSNPSEERRLNWERVISDWSASGLSMTAYCRLDGYSSSTFSGWKKRVRGSSPKSGDFVSVEFSRPETRPLRIVLGDGIEIEFGKKTDASYLGRVIEALQSVC